MGESGGACHDVMTAAAAAAAAAASPGNGSFHVLRSQESGVIMARVAVCKVRNLFSVCKNVRQMLNGLLMVSGVKA